MEPIVAKCGYRCDLCLAHEANFKGEEVKKRMIAALAKYYNCEVPPEAVKPCKGCQAATETPDPNCPVYPCAKERNVENCGHCAEFGCDKLKQRMDVVEECLKKAADVTPEDYRDFFLPYLSRGVLTEIRQRQE